MGWLYHTFLYQPLYNLLVFLYNVIPGHDIGIAIIVLTILLRLLLYPLNSKAIKSQKALKDLTPKIEELKLKYKDKKDLLGAEMMKLYKDNKVNPFSSCLPLLIQLPFLIAVYDVFRHGLSNGGVVESLYPFITNPGKINPVSFGIIDLSLPSYILAVLAGVAQFLQTNMLVSKSAPKIVKQGAKDENFLAEMNKSLKFFMPILTILIGITLPAGLTLYWLLTTLLTFVQQKLLFKKDKKDEQKKTPPVIKIEPSTPTKS